MKTSVIVRLVTRSLIAAPLLQVPLAAQQRGAADAPAPAVPHYSVIEMNTLSRDPISGSMYGLDPAFDPDGPPSRLVAVGSSFTSLELSGSTLIAHPQAVCYGTTGYVTDLGVPGASYAYGMNARGTVVGSVGDSAFRFRQGRTTVLPGLGGTTTVAGAVNAYDIVAGCDSNGPGHSKAMYWTADDQPHELQLGATDSVLVDINDQDVVVGYVQYAPDQDTQVFSLKLDGVSRPTLHSSPFAVGGCWPEAINERGQIVGHGTLYGAYQPVLWSDGQAFPLPVLPNEGTGGARATDINNHGVIVGSSNLGSAVIWINGTIYDLNQLVPGYSGFLKNARAINDQGVIACESEAGVNRAVLLVPRH